MTADIVGRAEEIRSWTTPKRPVDEAALNRYAQTAAIWEMYRLDVHRGASTDVVRRFEELTTALREMVVKLFGGPAGGEHGIVGKNGLLVGDVAYVFMQPWPEATEDALYGPA